MTATIFHDGDPVTFLHEDRWLVGTVRVVHETKLELLVAIENTVPALTWNVEKRDAFKLVPELEDIELPALPEKLGYTPADLRLMAEDFRARARAASRSVMEHDIASKRDPDPVVRLLAAARKSVARCMVQRFAQWAGVLEMNADKSEEAR